MWNIPLVPERASTIAGKVDAIFYALTLLSLAFAVPIAVLIVYFAVKYRSGAKVDRTGAPHENMAIEMSWIVIPLGLALGTFTWSSLVFLEASRPPARSLPIYVVGKQWMWYIQHPTRQREINELHVPIGQPVRLIMSSQDVIHSFFVPAFRIKQDVLPGRYTETWFEATKTGEFHLHCAEYCGAQHATMGGRVVVMEPAQYQEWLSGGGGGEGTGQTDQPASLAATGEGLFQQFGCNGCHRPDGGGAGPSLVGIFGRPQPLQGGQTAVADEQYLRESILNPNARVVAGYQPIMPPYQGQISEDQLLALIEYIRSLGTNQQTGGQQ
ncbi:MAG: cytochrome c oxidase subunit II [Chloroflexota bacterium]|nr:cytochrome c oxidase subunit II [Chloroflexota bacterium]